MAGYRGLVEDVPIGSADAEADGGTDGGTDGSEAAAEADVAIGSTGDEEGGEAAAGEAASGEAATDRGGASGFDRWRRRSVTGTMMTGIALGLQEVFTGPKPEIAIVHEAPGGPPDEDQPIALSFDPDHPDRTVAVIRPWLLDPGGARPDPSADTPDQAPSGEP